MKKAKSIRRDAEIAGSRGGSGGRRQRYIDIPKQGLKILLLAADLSSRLGLNIAGHHEASNKIHHQ